MKTTRSFSLLTFLLLSGVVALSVAIYSANKEVAQSREMVKTQGEQMGFLVEEDDTKLHFRRLGGYPQMSFAFRYQLPKQKKYQLHIGSGPVEPQSGHPPSLMSTEISQDQSQRTLIVSLQKMPTHKGIRWTIQCIDGSKLISMICDDEFEFTWLQTYLAAFPTDDQVGNAFNFFTNAPSMVRGHGDVQVIDADKETILYKRGEFHPSALDSLTEDMKRDRETFMIWVEPIADVEEAIQSGSSAQPQF